MELPLGLMNKRILHANNLLMLPNRILVWREVRGCEKVYRFEGEAAVGKLFNGVVHIERFGVPNGQAGYLPTPFEHLPIPFSGEIKIAA